MTTPTSAPAATPTQTLAAPRAALDDAPLSVRGRLAAAWASLMFLYIYVDYFHLYKPGVVDGILEGKVFVFDVSPLMLTGFLAMVGIPAIMIALSAAVPAAVNRLVNLVVAAFYVPVTVFNFLGETVEWAPFYALSIGLELLLLAYILRAAATWPRARATASA